jgi:hypothetical protein
LYDYISREYSDLQPAPVTGAKYRLDPGSGQGEPQRRKQDAKSRARGR